MRIGVDCRSLQEPRPSGVSVYTKELLKVMLALPEAQQHEWVFFLNSHKLLKSPQQIQQIKNGLDYPNVSWRVKTLPNKFFTSLEVVASQPSLKWMFGDVDVVFVPNMQFFPVGDSSIPLVLTVHDLSFERYPDCLSLKGRLRHKLIKPKKFVAAAKSIIAVSEHTKEDLGQLYGVAADKVKVIYPGLMPHSSATTNIDLPENFILSLSTIEPRKNIDSLLQAFELIKSDHPDVTLVIAGGPAWKSKQTLKRIAESSSVKYLGYVDDSTKNQLLSQSSVFVYPSFYEGFGFPPLEAQAAGTPVLVGAHSSLPEVLDDSALYANVLDANSIARGLSHLLSDQELRARFIKLGYKNIERFKWQRSARQTLEALTTTK